MTDMREGGLGAEPQPPEARGLSHLTCGDFYNF